MTSYSNKTEIAKDLAEDILTAIKEKLPPGKPVEAQGISFDGDSKNANLLKAQSFFYAGNETLKQGDYTRI